MTVDEVKGDEQFLIMDLIPMGIFIIRSDYRIIFWNACMEDWTGIQRRDIVGKVLHDSIPEFGDARYLSRISLVFAGGAPVIFSSQLHASLFPSKLKGSRRRVYHTTVSPIPSGTGTGHMALFAVQDVTELTARINGYRQMNDRAMREIEDRKKAEEEKEKLIAELTAALSQVKTLSGMLPICASCKKIRDDDGYWRQVEIYIRDHAPVDFTHSICPDCASRYFPRLQGDSQGSGGEKKD